MQASTQPDASAAPDTRPDARPDTLVIPDSGGHSTCPSPSEALALIGSPCQSGMGACSLCDANVACCRSFVSCLGGTYQRGEAEACCEPGLDQTCNDNPVVSSLWGSCQPDGSCTCKSGFERNPRTGKCRQIETGTPDGGTCQPPPGDAGTSCMANCMDPTANGCAWKNGSYQCVRLCSGDSTCPTGGWYGVCTGKSDDGCQSYCVAAPRDSGTPDALRESTCAEAGFVCLDVGSADKCPNGAGPSSASCPNAGNTKQVCCKP